MDKVTLLGLEHLAENTWVFLGLIKGVKKSIACHVAAV